MKELQGFQVGTTRDQLLRRPWRRSPMPARGLQEISCPQHPTCPFWLVVYGFVANVAPKIDEQPVALAISIRSPNSCTARPCAV
jgi:hypothetical protein